ncbi:extracellular solute-binding protein [Paenibacillus aquistagni]|uniref:extracellular solute-binding protein n=1 Tax=Paenibacillus aquistagni TaxID=1852522 RepID=UPI00145BC6FF|nr:extracellular solute-binding protein [Paenibacillus aquistagni]NMM51478.1 extracellular solute-binding protein [Paenibacillus aquistagni]
MPSTKKMMVAVMMVLISVLIFSQLNNKLIKVNNNRDPKQLQSIGGSRLDRDTEQRTLRVEVSLPRLAFLSLQKMNETYMERYGYHVELVNQEAPHAMGSLEGKFRLGQPPDVLLIDSESIKRYARKGWLLPFESPIHNLETIPYWMKEQARWNGLTWGVPAYMDPYVLVWNKKSLAAYTGKETPPASTAEWMNIMTNWYTAHSLEERPVQEGAGHGAESVSMLPEALFAWQEQDQAALLAYMWRMGWIQPKQPGELRGEPDLSSWRPPGLSKSGSNGEPPERSSSTQVAGGSQEQGSARSPNQWQQSLIELQEFEEAFQSFAEKQQMQLGDALEQGDVLFAMLPYSEAMQGLKEPFAYEEPWDVKVPYGTWVHGRSFVISANSSLEEEARSWILYMTEQEQLQDMWELVSLLPADARIFEQNGTSQRRYVAEAYLQEEDAMLAMLSRSEELLDFMEPLKRWMLGDLPYDPMMKEWNEAWHILPFEQTPAEQEPATPKV